MAVLPPVIEKIRHSQPQNVVSLNTKYTRPSELLVGGLKGLYSVLGNITTPGPGVSRRTTSDGRGITFDGVYQSGYLAGNFLTSQTYSIIIRFRLNSAAEQALVSSSGITYNGNGLLVSSTVLKLQYNYGNSKLISSTFPSILDGKFHTVAVSRDFISGNAVFILDGRIISTGYFGGVGVISLPSWIGQLNGWGMTSTADISFYADYTQVVSVPELLELSANPWQIFAPHQQTLMVPTLGTQTVQPPTAEFEIDWGNPITKGLGFATTGVRPDRDAANGGQSSLIGTRPETVELRNSKAQKLAGSGGFNFGTRKDIASAGTANISVFVLYDDINVSACSGYSIAKVTSTYNYLAEINSGPQTFIFGVAGAASVVTFPGGAGGLTPYANRVVPFCGTYNGISADLYLDGTLKASTPRSTLFADNNDTLGLFCRTNGSSYATGQSVLLTAVFSRTLSADEVKSLSDNPWQIFKAKGPSIAERQPIKPQTSRLLGTSGGVVPTSAIITRKRALVRTSQPQSMVRANPFWVSHGLVALFDVRSGIEVISGDRPIAADHTMRVSSAGVSARFIGGSYQIYAHRPAYAQTGALTIAAVFDADTLTNYGALIAKQSTTTSHCPYELRIGKTIDASQINMLRSWASGYAEGQHSIGNLITAGSKNNSLIVSVNSGDICANGRCYVNGTKYLSSASPLGTPCSDNGAPVYIGKRYDNATKLDGGIYYIALFDRQLSDELSYKLSAEKHSIFAPDTVNLMGAYK